MPKPPKLREIDIQLACVDFLALDGWRPLRTDPCSDRRRGKGFGEVGMADHLFLRYDTPEDRRCLQVSPRTILSPDAQVLWVEFKRPAFVDDHGRRRASTKASQHQLDWHTAERARGAFTVVAGIDFGQTYDGFVAWYRKSGLLRRAGL